MKKHLVLFMIIALFIAEMTLQINPKLGFLLYVVFVGGVLVALGYSERLSQNGKIIIALMIIPMVRIAEMFLTFELFWRTIIFYTALCFLSVFYAVKFEGRGDFSTRKIKWLPIVMVLGIALGLFGNWIFTLEKHVDLFYFIPLVAFSEELLFRGLIQREIAHNYSKLEGIFASALVGMIFSISYGLPIAIFFLLTGMISAFIYSKSQNVWLCMGMSFFVNVIMFVM